MRQLSWTSHLSILLAAPIGLSAALGNAGCSAGVDPQPTAQARASALSDEWLPAAPPRTASPALFLPGVVSTPPEQLVQVYVVLSAAAPATAIPRGTDIRTYSSLRTTFASQLATVRAQQARVLPRVEAAGGQLVARIEKVGNALQVLVPAGKAMALGRIAEVSTIEPVPYFSRALAAGVPAIGAPELWQRAAPLDGEGVIIGIMDSGVDYLHADFGGPGTSAAFNANDSSIIEPSSFPTARVVGGKDLAGDAYDGNVAPQPDPDPLDCARQVGGRISGGHGTHVAGIAAGNGVLKDGSAFSGPYNQSLDPGDFEVYPGVAPKASLHAIRIFGCEGGTTLTGSAYDYAVDPNDDGDPSDRLDVLNASLGSDFGLGAGYQASLIDNLTRAGTVFVAAAGNAGSSFFITGQPAGYPSSLSVAATSEAPLAELRITAPASIAGKYAVVSGGNSAAVPTDMAIAGELVRAQPANACADFSNASAMAGKIVLIDRGTCTFDEKLGRAVDAGAAAAIVVQNNPGEPPFPMGGDAAIAIPAVMIGNADGQLLKSSGGAKAELQAVTGLSQLSPFSSRGPEVLSGGFKPEVAAPGGNIRSAGVGTGFKSTVNSGTSMASPMAAGAAALVRQAHPDWLPTEVKSALINTGAASYINGQVAPVSHIGGGRIQVDAAVDTHVLAAAEPSQGSGVSFEPLIVSSTSTSARTVRISNKGASAVDFDLLAQLTYPVAGVSVSASQPTLSVAPGSSADVELVLTFDPSQMTELKPDPTTPRTVRLGPDAEYGRHFLIEAGGALELISKTSGQPDLHVPFNGAVRPAGERSLSFASCAAGDTLTLEPSGESPLRSPVVGVFELGVQTDPEPLVEASADVLATGAASDLSTRAFEDASAFIAISVRGTWTTPAPNSFESFQSGFPGKYIARIDTTGDKIYDYELVAVAFDDVLVSYSVSRAGAQGSGRFFNILPVDVLNTQAYYNSVMVLPVFLADLGLSQENSSFNYQVVTINSSGTVADSTAWASFNPSKPGIDASEFGETGRPLFGGASLIQVKVDRSADARALILHFDNVAEQRAQVLEVPKAGGNESNLSLSVNAPESIRAGSSASATLRVSHLAAGDAAAPRAAKLKLKVDGASLLGAVPSVGTCNAAARSCDLGELAPGDEASVELTLRGLDGSRGSVGAEISSDVGCGANAEDDTAESSFTLEANPSGDESGLDAVSPAGGGCSCRSSGNTQPPSHGLALFLGAGLWLWRRRRAQG